MPIIMQSTFFVEVLSLKAQVVFNGFDFFQGNVTVSTAFDFPDDLACFAGEFSGGTKVVQMVVINIIILHQCYGPKTVWFIKVGFFEIVNGVLFSNVMKGFLFDRRPIGSGRYG